MADWMSIFSGGAGSLLSAVGSIWSTNQQKKENEKNRRFQAEQARLSRQYNTQMVNDQNLYNSPSETVKRLLDAGINPALAYNNGASLGSVGVGSTSQMGSGTGGVNPPSIDTSGISSIGINASQSIKNLQDAALSKAKAGLSERELFYFDELKAIEIDQGHLNIDIGNDTRVNIQSNTKLTNEQTRYYSQLTANVEALTQQVKVATDGLKYDNVIKKLRSETERERIIAELDNLVSQTELNSAQAYEIGSLLIYRQMALQAQANHDNEAAALCRKEGEKIDNYIKNEWPQISSLYQIQWANGEMDWQLKNASLAGVKADSSRKQSEAHTAKIEARYAEINAVIGVVGETVGILTDVVDAFKPGVPVPQRVRVQGFRP